MEVVSVEKEDSSHCRNCFSNAMIRTYENKTDDNCSCLYSWERKIRRGDIFKNIHEANSRSFSPRLLC